MLHLLFVLHNHQPLGNLPDVFRKAYDIAYKPFLDVVRKYPGIKWALHTSGCLWEWLEKEEPGYLDALKKEHAAGRLEFLTGAMWEPIQPIISEQSFHKHYDLMRKYLGDKFGVNPIGSWTTERVWEPSLAGRLADQKIQYTLLDDSQLRASLPTKAEHPVWGYYQTEHNGKSVNIFPINEQLRYMIPFSKVDDVIFELEKMSDELPDGASVTYGDDGEKFGLWPETFEWVFGSGWLDDFLKKLEKNSKVTTTHPSEYLKMMPYPRKRVYVPTSSYREMGIWSLYPKRSLAADELHDWVEANDEMKSVEPPHSAGLFRNFLAKYPETRFMHERVQEIIEIIIEKEGPDVEASIDDKASNASKALWHALRAQCNCPYWHGVFGGLYLNYLRFAINREILHAEGYLRELLDTKIRKIGTHHFSASGEKIKDTDSIVLLCQNPDVQWAIDPTSGQVISAASIESKIDVIDVIARRFEAYHATMKDADEVDCDAQPASIHDMQEIAPAGWKENFGYDSVRRGCFTDRLSTSTVTLGIVPPSPSDSLKFGPEDGPWETEITKNGLRLTRDEHFVTRTKNFIVDPGDPVLTMNYVLKINGDLPQGSDKYENLTLTFDLGLLAGNASDRYFIMPDESHQPLESKHHDIRANCLNIIDEWTGVRIYLEVDGAVSISTDPVKTLSRGEAGLELNYQGTSITFLRPIELDKADEHKIEARMGIYPL